MAKRTGRKASQTPGFKANIAVAKHRMWASIIATPRRALPPPSKAEADAAIARYLATRPVTRCPTRAAEAINAGDGFAR